MLGDTLSRAPHASIDDDPVVNDVEVPYIQFEYVISGYEDDQFFGPIVRAMDDKWPDDPKMKLKIEKMMPCLLYTSDAADD